MVLTREPPGGQGRGEAGRGHAGGRLQHKLRAGQLFCTRRDGLHRMRDWHLQRARQRQLHGLSDGLVVLRRVCIPGGLRAGGGVPPWAHGPS